MVPVLPAKFGFPTQHCFQYSLCNFCTRTSDTPKLRLETMRSSFPTARACSHAYSQTKVTVSVAAKQSLLDNLNRYRVGSLGSRARDASFSSIALATALKEVNKHLSVLPDEQDEGRPAIKQHQKARWVYCCNAQQLAMLSTLVPQIGDKLEYFYLGGAYFLQTKQCGACTRTQKSHTVCDHARSPTSITASVHLSKGSSADDTRALVSDNIAATFAALEMVLRELRRQPSLRALRVDINVVLPPLMPFERSAPLVDPSYQPIKNSMSNITAAFQRLLDENTSLKHVKIGLDPSLAVCFDTEALTQRRQRVLERRAAVVASRHARYVILSNQDHAGTTR